MIQRFTSDSACRSVTNISWWVNDFFSYRKGYIIDVNIGLYGFWLGHPSVCPLLWTLLVIHHPISSKFQIRISFIKPSLKFIYGFCPSNDQDGHQNGCCLLFCSCKHACRFALVNTLTLSFITGLLPDYFHQTLVHV